MLFPLPFRVLHLIPQHSHYIFRFRLCNDALSSILLSRKNISDELGYISYNATNFQLKAQRFAWGTVKTTAVSAKKTNVWFQKRIRFSCVLNLVTSKLFTLN